MIEIKRNDCESTWWVMTDKHSFNPDIWKYYDAKVNGIIYTDTSTAEFIEVFNKERMWQKLNDNN